MQIKLSKHLPTITLITLGTWFFMFVLNEGVERNALFCAVGIFALETLRLQGQLGEYESGKRWVIKGETGSPCPACHGKGNL